MSSTRSSQSPMATPAEDEPRKKGARGGKRSVTHLSKAQLARKRANDREAQRNIRQRTKEHIENLERKVKELEQGGRSSSMERVLKRNRELESEIERLKAQVSAQHAQSPVAGPSADGHEEMLLPQKVSLDWHGEPTSCPWPKAGTPTPQLEINPDLPVSSTSYPPPNQIYTPTTSSVAGYDEGSQHMYTASTTPLWDEPPTVYGPATSQSLSKPLPAWAPFHPSFSQPSRFADLQQAGFNDLVSNPGPPYNGNSTCWQSQPSVYAWQISTKLKPPTTYVDQLMFSVIHSQRHLAITADLTGEDIIGSSYPSVHLLFNQAGPLNSKDVAATEVMTRYSAVLANRGFALIPEKLASFMCMYRFIQWQISPTYDTYKTLHEWQAPRPSQLLIHHPAWMDLPPWGLFRDKVIENQARYDNMEFQNDYASNLNVNFRGDPMKALIFEDGRIMVSDAMERHLSNIENMSMKRPFAEKYPEFRDVCRFEEV